MLHKQSTLHVVYFFFFFCIFFFFLFFLFLFFNFFNFFFFLLLSFFYLFIFLFFYFFKIFLLDFGLRHHKHDLIIAEVFDAAMGPSSSPNSKLFRRFASAWETIDKFDYKSAMDMTLMLSMNWNQ